jgi:hypothetical protein
MRVIEWLARGYRRIMDPIVGPLGPIQSLEPGLDDEGEVRVGYVPLDQKRAMRALFLMFGVIVRPRGAHRPPGQWFGPFGAPTGSGPAYCPCR